MSYFVYDGSLFKRNLMMSNNHSQRLELTWIGKGNQPRLEPRILIEDPEKSHGDKNTENMLIHGDNLLALKALEQDFAGKIKCIYIDPPFNTGQAFEHYDDGLEHSIWLNMMRNRLEILHRLLREDGSIFVHIDDNELGYLIILLDEIFFRKNRIAIITFKQGAATGHKSINPGCVNISNFILIYAKNKAIWEFNRVFTARKRDKRYTQYIVNKDANYSDWQFTTLRKAFATHMMKTERELKKELGKEYESHLNKFVLSNAEKVVRLARPDYKGVGADARKLIDESKINPGKVFYLQRDNYPDMYFIKGERILFYSDKVKLIDGKPVAGEPLTTIWDDLLSNNLHNEGGVKLPKGKKPEALIKRILELSTNEGDWVIDSFAGSGTTGAVAHKMSRKWIMCELGEHCHTLIIPRLINVINKTDQSGITEIVNWQGSGGFKYYYLAPSLLKEDKYGHWIIEKRYNADMLAAAMAKHEGFKYCPDEQVYWKQGRSTEKDFIFTTTQFATVNLLDSIHEQMKLDESLLICCTSFQEGCKNQYPNINIKKIPNMLLGRCEFGKDDYSLNIINMPIEEENPEFFPPPEPAIAPEPALEKEPKKEKKKPNRYQLRICD